MRRFWPCVYFGGTIVCLAIGYHNIASKSLPHPQVNWNDIALSFLVFTLGPIGMVALRRVFRGEDTLQRPSQFAKPTNSSLQFIRVMLVALAAICLGGSAALPWAKPEIFMLFWANAATVLSLFLAEQIIYRIWSKKIIP